MRTASLALLLGLTSTAPAAEPALELDKAESAIIDARHWDQTQQQWLTYTEKQGQLFCDAVHRFLLLRFPGCAEAIHEQLAAGQEIASAKLVMQYADAEFLRIRGYEHRSWDIQRKKLKPPKWHVRAWLVRQPWTADEKIGPTWNAYVNGAGYWRAGGAFDTTHDRFGKSLGTAELHAGHRNAEIDLTTILASKGLAATLPERLRRLEACGFLLHKDEVYITEFGAISAPLGTARIWIRDPKLVVTFKPSTAGKPGALPPAVDVAAMAEKLAAAGGDGQPTTRVPENLKALIATYQARRASLPKWMQQRLQELIDMKTKWDKMQPLFGRLDQIDPNDAEQYNKELQRLLAQPPAYFLGHSHIDPIMTLLDCGPMLPEVARYHLQKGIACRWQRPFKDSPGRHGWGYFGQMGTLNHQSQSRAEALLAGEILGDADLAMMARRNLSLLNRQMVFVGGVIQEHGDSFYQSISMTNLKAISRYSTDPLTRLKADLGAEKEVWELNSTYHPGLKRQVSPVARRYRLTDLVMAQDCPRSVLHTLSKKGVLIQTDKRTVHGMPVLGYNAATPLRVVSLAPWGREEEANAVDNKPIPFTSIGTHAVRGLAPEPIWYTTHMGRNYAMSSSHIDMSQEWSNLTVWRRPHRDVTKLDDLGIMFIWGYLNGKHLNLRKHAEGPCVRATPLTACLQHANKMIHVIRPPERKLIGDQVKGGIQSFMSRVSIYAYGPDSERTLSINGEPVKEFPATAKQGDRITIHEGASYVGLIALPTPDMGRETEVVISYKYPRLNLDSYAMNLKEPLPTNDATWKDLMNTTAGWVVELGDVDEHGSFGAFQKHMSDAKLSAAWDAEARTLRTAYASGPDRMELGFKTSFMREIQHVPVPASKVIAYARVNGKDPYPRLGIQRDCPLGQMGKTGRLERGGAVLKTMPGQTALLKVEPVSGTYTAINPFIEPVPLELTVPGGVVVRSERPFGCGRVVVCPKKDTIWVDYRLPPPEGEPGVVRLQEDAKKGLHGGPKEWEAPLSQFFRPDYDVRNANRDSTRWLLVSGTAGPPKVILNGKPLAGEVATIKEGNRTWYRIRIAPDK